MNRTSYLLKIGFGKRTARHYFLVGLLAFWIAPLVIGRANASVSRNSGKDVLNVLRGDRFTVIWHVAEVPLPELLAARALPPRRTIQSVMVDAGGDYQDRHSGIDFGKPTAQLVFGAMSPRYILLCYLTGGLTKAEHLMLIQRDSKHPRVVAKGLVSPVARNFDELKVRLKSNDYLAVDLRSTYIVPSLGIH